MLVVCPLFVGCVLFGAALCVFAVWFGLLAVPD